jgi:hypothetical protein
MCVPTELRDSAKTKKSGTMFHPKIDRSIPLLMLKDGNLFYVTNGKLELAQDIDPEPLAYLTLAEIPSRILHLVAGKLLKPGVIILYARKMS